MGCPGFTERFAAPQICSSTTKSYISSYRLQLVSLNRCLHGLRKTAGVQDRRCSICTEKVRRYNNTHGTANFFDASPTTRELHGSTNKWRGAAILKQIVALSISDTAHIRSKMKRLDTLHKEKKRVNATVFNACVRKHEVLSNKVFWLYNAAYLCTITVALSSCYCKLLLLLVCRSVVARIKLM